MSLRCVSHLTLSWRLLECGLEGETEALRVPGWLFALPTKLFSSLRTTEGPVFPALVSRRLIIFSPNYPLKFRLPEFSPGGCYSGKFHQNPFSVREFSELGAGWEESGACLCMVWGLLPRAIPAPGGLPGKVSAAFRGDGRWPRPWELTQALF